MKRTAAAIVVLLLTRSYSVAGEGESAAGKPDLSYKPETAPKSGVQEMSEKLAPPPPSETGNMVEKVIH